jgi:6-phosphofructokinase 1
VLGGIGATWPWKPKKRTGPGNRHVVLSHLQRGGQPSAQDRLMGRWMGIAAVDLILREQFGRMVAWRHGEMASVPLAEAVAKLQTVEVSRLYDTERYNGRRSSLLT